MTSFTKYVPSSDSDSSQSSSQQSSGPTSNSTKAFEGGGGQRVINKFKGDNPPEDFEFPSMGIEDIDRAVFKLFDDKIRFQVTQKGESKKVPVVFAAGERFALTRRKNPIRDKNNALILPLISIMRNEVDISPSQNGKKTAISFREQTSYIIKRRLSKKDREYQNLINKQDIRNQKNVPGKGTNETRRASKGYDSKQISLDHEIGNNIFEIIEIPYPEFVSVSYEVTFWTQYVQQANEMIETLLFNFEGQGEEITMATEAGYELVAFFKSPINNTANFDNYTDDERIVKHTISLSVPGYIINPKHAGIPNLLRSYYSAPVIEFGYVEPRGKLVHNLANPSSKEIATNNVLTDLTNPYEDERRGDLSALIEDRKIINPFTGESVASFSKIRHRNERAGETVASSRLSDDISTQNE